MAEKEKYKYELSELTPLNEAVRILVRAGLNVNPYTMRDHLRNGSLKGQKVGATLFVLDSEIQRLQDEAKSEAEA